MGNKKKFKGFTGRKRCSGGEFYSFRKGIATIPGYYYKGKSVKITLKEFNQLQRGE